MKSERRHELQENSLIRGVRTFPEFWQAYGSKISLVIILMLLAAVLTQYYLNNKERAKLAVAQDLTHARNLLETFRAGDITADGDGGMIPDQVRMVAQFRARMSQSTALMQLPPDLQSQVRERTWNEVDQAVRKTLEESKDPVRQAEALLLRGDLNLYWSMLASDAGGSTTKPTMALPQSSGAYLDHAKADYEQLLGKGTALPSQLLNAARFGMAAVMENLHQPSEASKLYVAITQNTSSDFDKSLASARDAMLSTMQNRPLIGPNLVPPPATVPTMGPMTTTSPAGATQPSATEPSATESSAIQPAATGAVTGEAAPPATRPSDATAGAATRPSQP